MYWQIYLFYFTIAHNAGLVFIRESARHGFSALVRITTLNSLKVARGVPEALSLSWLIARYVIGCFALKPFLTMKLFV
jgi:hypothetical protein